MIWILGPIVLFIIIELYVFVQTLRRQPQFMRAYGSERDWGYMGFFLVVGLLATFVVGFLGNAISARFVDQHWEYKGFSNIYSLADSGGTYGRFVLGTGVVSERPVYRYYSESGDGGYRLYWVYSDNASVFEDAGYSPRVNFYESVSDNPWLSLDSGHTKYDIVVPPGTVKRSFSLDAQ